MYLSTPLFSPTSLPKATLPQKQTSKTPYFGGGRAYNSNTWYARKSLEKAARATSAQLANKPAEETYYRKDVEIRRGIETAQIRKQATWRALYPIKEKYLKAQRQMEQSQRTLNALHYLAADHPQKRIAQANHDRNSTEFSVCQGLFNPADISDREALTALQNAENQFSVTPTI